MTVNDLFVGEMLGKTQKIVVKSRTKKSRIRKGRGLIFLCAFSHSTLLWKLQHKKE